MSSHDDRASIASFVGATTVRRHEIGFAAASAVTVALIVGFGSSTWSFLRERRARAGEAIQREAADAFRGRVMALVGMVASLAQIAGYAVAGPLIEWLGPRSALVIAGLAVCFVAVPVVSLAFTMARAERTAPAPSA